MAGPDRSSSPHRPRFLRSRGIRGKRNMALKLRRPAVALSGVGAMVVGPLVVSLSGSFQLPLNIVLLVFGLIGAVTGGLVLGVVAVAWLLLDAVQLSEPPHRGRPRPR